MTNWQPLGMDEDLRRLLKTEAIVHRLFKEQYGVEWEQGYLILGIPPELLQPEDINKATAHMLLREE